MAASEGEYWTANQLVANNLRVLRQQKGWSQEQAAEELDKYLGVRWSRANFSAAERSVDGRYIRHFSADELGAFCLTFGVPIARFFSPPDSKRRVSIRLGESESDGIELAAFLSAVFGSSIETGSAARERDAFKLGMMAGAYEAKYGSNILGGIDLGAEPKKSTVPPTTSPTASSWEEPKRPRRSIDIANLPEADDTDE